MEDRSWKYYAKLLVHLLAMALLTVLTQVGGVVYILCFGFQFYLARFKQRSTRWLLTFLGFAVAYLLFSFVLLPPLAKPGGRVPLPIFEGNLRPLTLWTCILNRHYVNPELKAAAEDVANSVAKKFPGTTLHYLDANFPLFDGFRLLPHLSHGDGNKLDLAFFYQDTKTKAAVSDAPSPIGYGVSEEPRTGEVDYPGQCAAKGYWQYSLLKKIIPQGSANDFTVDASRTVYAIKRFTDAPAIKKIFLEPHLRERWKIKSVKLRFHGCQAVRHDDHFHVQL